MSTAELPVTMFCPSKRSLLPWRNFESSLSLGTRGGLAEALESHCQDQVQTDWPKHLDILGMG